MEYSIKNNKNVVNEIFMNNKKIIGFWEPKKSREVSGAAARTGEFSKIRIRDVVKNRKGEVFNRKTHDKYRAAS